MRRRAPSKRPTGRAAWPNGRLLRRRDPHVVEADRDLAGDDARAAARQRRRRGGGRVVDERHQRDVVDRGDQRRGRRAADLERQPVPGADRERRDRHVRERRRRRAEEAGQRSARGFLRDLQAAHRSARVLTDEETVRGGGGVVAAGGEARADAGLVAIVDERGARLDPGRDGLVAQRPDGGDVLIVVGVDQPGLLEGERRGAAVTGLAGDGPRAGRRGGLFDRRPAGRIFVLEVVREGATAAAVADQARAAAGRDGRGCSRGADVVGAGVAVVADVAVVVRDGRAAVAVALHDLAVAGRLRDEGRARGDVGDAAGVVGGADVESTGGVRTAIGRGQAGDAVPLAVAEAAAETGGALGLRGVRRRARRADVVGAGVAVVDDVAVVVHRHHAAGAVTLGDAAVARGLGRKRRALRDVGDAAGLIGVAGVDLAGRVRAAVAGRQALRAVALPVADVAAAAGGGGGPGGMRRRARDADVVGADVADGKRPAEAVALHHAAIAGNLRRQRRPRRRVGHPAGVVGAAGVVLALGVRAAVGVHDTADTGAPAVADVAASARCSG